MQYSYDPFFLYPLGSVLADALRDLYRDARDVALIPQGEVEGAVAGVALLAGCPGWLRAVRVASPVVKLCQPWFASWRAGSNMFPCRQLWAGSQIPTVAEAPARLASQPAAAPVCCWPQLLWVPSATQLTTA